MHAAFTHRPAASRVSGIQISMMVGLQSLVVRSLTEGMRAASHQSSSSSSFNMTLGASGTASVDQMDVAAGGTPKGADHRRRGRITPEMDVDLNATSFFKTASISAARRRERGHKPWIDVERMEKDALVAHRTSPEYRELHRPGLTNAAMGLFGGEPGFEKTHRIWVDPDNSHLKFLYNTTTLAKNLRYTRYGYFKREMQIIDVDKLVRHGRLLPPPERLLTDFLYQRVPLDDRSCAALLRYMKSTLEKLSSWEQVQQFPKAVEMFERLLATNLPPVEVGVEAHAEMIQCCAVCKRWEEGWMQYHQRAVELDAQSQELSVGDEGEAGGHDEEDDAVVPFALTPAYFDAVLQLCSRCGRGDEAVHVFREMVRRGLKPLGTSLDSMQEIMGVAADKSHQRAEHGRTSDAVPQRLAFDAAQRLGDESWALYEFFDIPRTLASYRGRMILGALTRRPHEVLEALRLADQSSVALDETCFCWLLYSLVDVPEMADYVLQVLSQCKQVRALSIDYRLITYAMMYCATHGEGDAALLLYQQHVMAERDMNVTPENLLLLTQSFLNSPEPTVDMLMCAQDAWKRFERIGSAVDLRNDVLDTVLRLCGRLGATATGFSFLKHLLASGEAITVEMLNALLAANVVATSPNGSKSMTDDVVQLMEFLHLQPTMETVELVLDCHDKHGSTERVQDFVNPLLKKIETWRGSRKEGDDKEAVEDEDADVELLPFPEGRPPVAVRKTPPHQIRQLRTDWKLDVEAIQLKKYGQSVPPTATKKTHGNPQVFGVVKPFGHWPGLVNVS